MTSPGVSLIHQVLPFDMGDDEAQAVKSYRLGIFRYYLHAVLGKSEGELQM